MQSPEHQFLRWIVASIPLIALLGLWALGQKMSLRRAAVCFWVGYPILFVASVFTDPWLNPPGNRTAHLVCDAAFWTCFVAAFWTSSWYSFEWLRPPSSKWYLPWKSARLSMPAQGVRIRVRDVDSVLPWYKETFGIREVGSSPSRPGEAFLRLKVGGNPLILNTRDEVDSRRIPMLFTKKILKLRDVLLARGVSVGAIEQEGPRVRYFDIHDPEGNVIEFVEEH